MITDQRKIRNVVDNVVNQALMVGLKRIELIDALGGAACLADELGERKLFKALAKEQEKQAQ